MWEKKTENIENAQRTMVYWWLNINFCSRIRNIEERIFFSFDINIKYMYFKRRIASFTGQALVHMPNT